MIDDEHTTDAAMGVLRTCPCYLHYGRAIEPLACICECDHSDGGN